ncbi:MAG TPA: DUF998 domain-containing protein [Actinoplanes sp.]|jgi:Protein of unknown function (DUF998)|nr:DUF998 domain-containing protein [Actinoplanes sp.]
MALLAPPGRIRTSAPTTGEARLGRWLAFAAAAGIALAALLGVAAHVNTRPGLSAVSLTISDFAVSDRGGPMDAAMVVLGVASGALVAAMATLRTPVLGVPAALLLVWSGGLITAAIVPTDPIGAAMSGSAYVHRYVSVAAFVCLPAAGALCARRLRRDPHWTRAARGMRALAAVSGALLAALMYVAGPGERVFMGLVERALVGAEVLLVALLAVRLIAISRDRSSRSRSAPLPQAASPTTAIGADSRLGCRESATGSAAVQGAAYGRRDGPGGEDGPGLCLAL